MCHDSLWGGAERLVSAAPPLHTPVKLGAVFCVLGYMYIYVKLVSEQLPVALRLGTHGNRTCKWLTATARV